MLSPGALFTARVASIKERPSTVLVILSNSDFVLGYRTTVHSVLTSLTILGRVLSCQGPLIWSPLPWPTKLCPPRHFDHLKPSSDVLRLSCYVDTSLDILKSQQRRPTNTAVDNTDGLTLSITCCVWYLVRPWVCLCRFSTTHPTHSPLPSSLAWDEF